MSNWACHDYITYIIRVRHNDSATNIILSIYNSIIYAYIVPLKITARHWDIENIVLKIGEG